MKWLLTMLTMLALPLPVGAHDSPEHEIEALTAKMAVSGESAELLSRRATEWRAMGKLEQACADLEQAVALDGKSVALLTELARVEAARGKFEQALKGLNRALKITEDELDRATVYMERAEVLESKGEHELALADCERAFRAENPPIDWYLTRARLQSRCEKAREAAAGLKEGFERTGSIVLEIEWIETLIDAGEFKAALERIEAHLGRVRWKSGWLVRRARAQSGLGNTEGARASAEAALRELTRRINPSKPDLMLVTERGLARAVVGKERAARKDLEILRLAGGAVGFSASYQRLERVLRR